MAFGGEPTEEDRLPWLETVDSEEPERRGFGCAVIAALIGLALIAALVFAGYRMLADRASGGDGALIAAPKGPYKIRPSDPGGLEVRGEGAVAIATSQGATNNAAIDWSAAPEAPIISRREGAPGQAAGGAFVQIGDYPSEAAANTAWKAFAKRFSYLTDLTMRLQTAQAGETPTYRLRIEAGSAAAAADICGRLRVAGETCSVTD